MKKNNLGYITFILLTLNGAVLFYLYLYSYFEFKILYVLLIIGIILLLISFILIILNFRAKRLMGENLNFLYTNVIILSIEAFLILILFLRHFAYF